MKVTKVILMGNLGRDHGDGDRNNHYYGGGPLRHSTGRDHCPQLSISDDMPEAGGGGVSDSTDVAVNDDDDDGGDSDGEPARSRPRKNQPTFKPALLAFSPLSHYVGFGRSRIYALISQGEFPPPVKIGKSSRWVLAEIDAWLNGQVAARNSLSAG